MLRTVLVLLLLLAPIAAGAAPTPEPAPAAERSARDGGMIDGRLTVVDYQKSTVAVDGGGRGRLAVTVMPSTTIQGRDAGYHSILDLKPGEHVQIFSSVVGGTYVAQIIRILP
jgi:hypothetical protein